LSLYTQEGHHGYNYLYYSHVLPHCLVVSIYSAYALSLEKANESLFYLDRVGA
jgi:hypothetical protein